MPLSIDLAYTNNQNSYNFTSILIIKDIWILENFMTLVK